MWAYLKKNISFIFVYDVMTSDYYGSETGKNDAAIRKGKLASGTEEQYVKASVKTEVAVTSRIHGESWQPYEPELGTQTDSPLGLNSADTLLFFDLEFLANTTVRIEKLLFQSTTVVVLYYGNLKKRCTDDVDQIK